MEAKKGWIVREVVDGFIDNGVEGIRTGGCSHNTPDCIQRDGI